MPQARSWMLSAGELRRSPLGSNESWSMIERRTRRRCSASLRLEPSKFIGPTTFSDSGKPRFVFVVGELDVTVAPAGMSSSLAAADRGRGPATRAPRSERLVTVPVIRPSASRSAASTTGPSRCPRPAPCAASRPDLEVADARRRALEHVQAGARAAAEHVTVHRRREQESAIDSQLERRARRAEDAEVRLGGRLVVPGAPRTIATWWTITSAPRRSGPIPNAPTVNTPIRTGTVIHAHSRRSSRLQDEVVHRADEDDVAEQQHEQARDRRQREARQVGHRADDLRVVERDTVPAVRCGSSLVHIGASSSSPSAIQDVVGSKPSSVTDPAP